ncbi:DUF4785 family protein [Permianibacter sp. IMCC34836]|uniref:DUF4785 domain-containing protein n=1 Tax=Permianibacter fluminis TaxID=2738515 RepID=UPI001553BB6E|nr:DUF4785 domain-containing protein [Permianibacter fluminis]NQD37149.1 DUF4785 family protein [Permianibacter fluminis]
MNNLNKRSVRTAIIGAVIGLTGALPVVAAETLKLLPAVAGDQIPGDLRPAISAPWQNDNREPVSVSYALDMDSALSLNPKPEAVESKEYWRKISGAELNRGIDLPTTAPGALLRISGFGNGNQASKSVLLVDGEALSLRSPQGREQSLASAAQSLYQAAKDQPSNLPFARGSVAAKLDADMGAGVFTLTAKQPMPADAEFVVQVFEPDSPYRLQAKHANYNVLAGGSLNAEGVLLHEQSASQAAKALPVQAISAVLLAPDGRRLPLTVARGTGNRWQIAQLLDAPTADVPGLWEVEWQLKTTDNGLTVERQLRSAFAFAAPSARLGKQLQLSKTASNVTLQIPLTVASEGRYEVRAVVSGKDGTGVVRPVLFASSANWLQAGERKLSLTLDKSVLTEAGVSGTLAVQDLQLIDQSRMSVLQRQAQALSLRPAQWQGNARLADNGRDRR